MKHRIIGIAMFVIALYLYYQRIHVPLEQMKTHAPQIKVSSKLIVCLPLIAGAGLFYLFNGERMEHGSVAFLITAIPLFALGIWWWVWFGHQMDKYGYGKHAYVSPDSPRFSITDQR